MWCLFNDFTIVFFSLKKNVLSQVPRNAYKQPISWLKCSGKEMSSPNKSHMKEVFEDTVSLMCTKVLPYLQEGTFSLKWRGHFAFIKMTGKATTAALKWTRKATEIELCTLGPKFRNGFELLPFCSYEQNIHAPILPLSQTNQTCNSNQADKSRKWLIHWLLLSWRCWYLYGAALLWFTQQQYSGERSLWQAISQVNQELCYTQLQGGS